MEGPLPSPIDFVRQRKHEGNQRPKIKNGQNNFNNRPIRLNRVGTFEPLGTVKVQKPIAIH